MLRNVLIFHFGALGDFVVSWPLALALSRLHPQSRIFYVTAASKGKLAEKALRVDSIDIEAGFHHLFGDANALPETSRKLIQDSHSIYTFIATPNDNWCQNIQAMNPQAKITCINPRPPEGDPYPNHISQWFADQLASSPAAKGAYDQILRSIQTRGVGYKRSPDGSIVIHPGSGSGKKNWPSSHFVQLARKFTKARRHVRVILGEVEKEQLPKEDIEHFRSIAEVIEPKHYVQLLEQLSTAQAAVCNDTGPGHLAAIIGVPTFTLFGPTSNPARWQPIGPHTHPKSTPDLTHLSADEVHKWISAEI